LHAGIDLRHEFGDGPRPEEIGHGIEGLTVRPGTHSWHTSSNARVRPFFIALR
jgi:hypothetical protein